jgi:DNA topoisomerase IB
MTERHASCSCGQLAVVTRAEPIRISICHCLACQRRTGSVFGTQARFPEFTSKDFRTWAGTVLALEALRACGPFGTKKHAQREIVRAVDGVASRLGNTRAVCRKSYVHPAVLAAFESGALSRVFARRAGRGSRPPAGLGEGEIAVLRLLEGERPRR